MEIACVIVGFGIFAILMRLLAGSMDDNRVERYIEERGGRMVSKQWAPFGKGWFGEKDSRIYTVQYYDSAGNLHDATVKTSMLSGVYFTEDQIVTPAPRKTQHLNAENESQLSEIDQLRAENQRLKAKLRDQENQ